MSYINKNIKSYLIIYIKSNFNNNEQKEWKYTNIKTNTIKYLYTLRFVLNINHIFKYFVSINYEVLKIINIIISFKFNLCVFSQF